jgi:hypothetical protein
VSRYRPAAALYLFMFTLTLSIECSPLPRTLSSYSLLEFPLFMVAGFSFAYVLFSLLSEVID